MCLFSSIFYKKDSKKAFIQNTFDAFLKHVLKMFKMLGPIDTANALVNHLSSADFEKNFQSIVIQAIIELKRVSTDDLNEIQINTIGTIIANILILELLDYPEDFIHSYCHAFEPTIQDMYKPFVSYWLHDLSEQDCQRAKEPFQKLISDTLQTVSLPIYFNTLEGLIIDTSNPLII